MKGNQSWTVSGEIFVPRSVRGEGYDIPDDARLIILDAHDTILKRNLRGIQKILFGVPEDEDKIIWKPREGLVNFLEVFARLQGRSIVISSDGRLPSLQDTFERYGIADHFTKVYGSTHIDPSTGLKRLDTILHDQKVDAKHVVFIGDSGIDASSAAQYGVRFIRVPPTENDRAFTFNHFLKRSQFDPCAEGLAISGITGSRRVFHNLRTPQLYEEIIRREEGRVVHMGAVAVSSGEHKDHLGQETLIVREQATRHRIWWGGETRSIEPSQFDRIFQRVLRYLDGRDLFVDDCFSGADSQHRIPLRIITETAWHGLFVRNMFIQASRIQAGAYLPEYTIIHVPGFRAEPDADGTPGPAFVTVNLLRRIAVIGGTGYSGEIRSCVFTIANHILPQEDVLPLRCSGSRTIYGRTILFFGHFRAGKTSLAFDPHRSIVADAFMGWSDEGVFNLEWGCYPNIRGISPYHQRHIWETTRCFGTMLENVVYSDDNLQPDFEDTSHTTNLRAAFPISHIAGGDRSGQAPHPQHVFFLVRDAFGVFPPFARLTPDQAFYHFLSGYGCRVETDLRGTVTEVEPVFAPAYGSYSTILHPIVYARLLKERIERHEVTCWLVNTGWVGNPLEGGYPITLNMARTGIDHVLQTMLQDTQWAVMPIFGLEYPVRIHGFSELISDPSLAWRDEALYAEQTRKLALMFESNMIRVMEQQKDEAITRGGPRPH